MSPGDAPMDEDDTSSVSNASSDDVQVVDGISQTFCSPTADVLLRSSDFVRFKVHTAILAEGCPGLHQLVASAGEDPRVTPVDVPERAAVLDLLLRYIYPMPRPESVPSLTLWQEHFLVARKYNITAALDGLRALLLSPSFLTDEPLRVYAIASRFDLAKEIDVAAQHTFGIELMKTELFDELNSMSSAAFVRLIQLHRKRTTLLREWSASLEAPYKKCNDCGRAHWMVTYVQNVRIACEREHIVIAELFRPSMIAEALVIRGLGLCENCPVWLTRELDEWFQKTLIDVHERIGRLSVASPAA